MTTSVSTSSCSSRAPTSAMRRRFPPLEVEGHGDEADGEHAHFAGGTGHDGRRSGACPSTHAGGDEDHV